MKFLSQYENRITSHLVQGMSDELLEAIIKWTKVDEHSQWVNEAGYLTAYDENGLMEWFKNAATITFHLAKRRQIEITEHQIAERRARLKFDGYNLSAK